MPPTVLTPTKPDAPSRTGDFGGGGDFRSDGFGGNSGGDARGWSVPSRTYRTGMWMALVAILMLFAAFTSALVVRKGMSNDWARTEIPRILWLNTAVLIASSATLEISRRSLSLGRTVQFARWLYATVALGVCFVAGQLLAWRELASRGIYLATNPSSSFFYLLTAAHGVHLLGGLIALSYIFLRAGRIAATPQKRTLVDVTAIYWHFMDGLWFYLLLLMTTRL